MELETISLCAFCQGIVSFRPDPLTRFPHSLPHHPDFGILTQSSAACRICKSLQLMLTDGLSDAVDLSRCHDWALQVAIADSSIMPSGVSSIYCEVDCRSPNTAMSMWCSLTVITCLQSSPSAQEQSWNAVENGIENRISVLKAWLQACRSPQASDEAIHRLCQPVPCRPRRLIHVGLDGTPPRLVAGEQAHTDDASGTVEYATLSHCWGSDGLPLRCTRKNIDQFTKSILSELIPKTFLDAMEIVRQLSIPYLWIDALCIVQDDEQEWQLEAARMDLIYHGSQLTIAAGQSPDSNHGCFPLQERGGFLDGEMFVRTHIAPDMSRQGAGQSVSLLVRVYKNEIFDRHIQRTVLSTRGWILQENILSSRQVWCMSPDMLWFCWGLYSIECGISRIQNASTSWPQEVRPSHHLGIPDDASEESVLDAWRAIVENYSCRQFTYESDRVAAIAGVIRYLGRFLPSDDEPILGMWKRTFGDGLAWIRLGEDPLKDSQTMHALPSWTWLTCKGCAVYRIWSWEKSTESNVTLLGSRIAWSGTPYTSPLLSAYVRAECAPIEEIEIAPLLPHIAGDRYDPPFFQVFGENQTYSDDDRYKTVIPWRCAGQFDDGEMPERRRHPCMLLKSIMADGNKMNSQERLYEIFLILERVGFDGTQRFGGLISDDENPDEILAYKRIGIAYIRSREGERCLIWRARREYPSYWYSLPGLDL
ncbi:HET domain containing protein [Rhypophila decipiens]